MKQVAKLEQMPNKAGTWLKGQENGEWAPPANDSSGRVGQVTILDRAKVEDHPAKSCFVHKADGTPSNEDDSI